MAASSSNLCDVASSDNLTREYWKLKGEQITHGYISASFLILFECIGFPWNVLVVVTIIKEKLYHKPTVILLLNLALADLFLLCVPMPLIMATALAGEFILGSTDSVRCTTCRMNIFILTPIMVSLFTVALMSLDRFLYIYSPFKYERRSTKYIVLIAIAVVILGSVGMGFAVTFAPGNLVFFPAFFLCIAMYTESSNSLPLILGILIIAILVFMFAINCSFGYIVMKNIKAVYSRRDFDHESQQQSRLHEIKKRIKSTRSKKQRRLCIMMSSLVFSSLVIILPWLGLLLYVARSSDSSDSVPILATIFLIMAYSQVVLHPVIQTCFVPDIQEPIKRLITCGYFSRKKKMGLNEKKEKYNMFTNCLGARGEKTVLLITAIKAAFSPRDVTSFTDNETPEINGSEL